MANQTNSYIEEVLEDFGNNFERVMGSTMTTYIEDNRVGLDAIVYEDVEGFITQALQKQQDIIKECLPEESEDGDEYCDCFNECRQQFLDNLKERGIVL